MVAVGLVFYYAEKDGVIIIKGYTDYIVLKD